MTEQGKTDAADGLWLNKDGKRICCNPWTHFEINNANGDVTMCCDYGSVLGNVNEQSIADIWNGKKYQQVRREMYEAGAEKMCNPNCLLLNGAKRFESLSWFDKIDKDNGCYRNALLSESEIRKGGAVLSSFPRWISVSVTYKCNYRCYHCYQADKHDDNQKLPETFMEELKNYFKYFQIFFILGGEPTLAPEFFDLLKLGASCPHVKYGMVSNGSLIHKCFKEIERINWAFISISLDAATKENYELLRRSKNWERVNQNLELIAGMKKERDFDFPIGMTVNRKNYNEIYDFVLLARKYGGMPKINLVSVPNASARFYHKYLSFSDKQKKAMLEQIERAAKDLPDVFGETGLNVLKRQISAHGITAQVTDYLRIIAQKVLVRYPSFFDKLKRFKKSLIR